MEQIKQVFGTIGSILRGQNFFNAEQTLANTLLYVKFRSIYLIVGVLSPSRVGSWRKILVFDLGGGTFDVSIMTVAKDKFKVEAVAGDTYLGGDDVDERLLMHLVDEIKCKFGKDISSDKKALSQLRTACEEAKRHLSFNKIASIHMAGFIDGKDYVTKVSQSLFEEINKDLFMKTIQTVEKALSDAEMAKSDIHDVVLVGGSTRIPKIRALLEDFFDGKRLCKGINPDEAVAHGAAVQAAILKGDKSESIRNVHLYDVTPLSLGVEILGGSTSVVIVRNTTIPIQETKRYFTSSDNQVVVSINVYEGERKMVKDNNFLGKFLLKGLPAAPKGHVKLDITFDIDTNGTLTVTAVETSRCIKDSITITNDQGRLSKDDVTRMIQEAAKYKEEDKKLMQIGLNKVKLEDYVRIITSKIASISMDNISETEKKQILDNCDTIYKWLAEEEPRKAQDYVNKQLELEYIWNPIQKKMM